VTDTELGRSLLRSGVLMLALQGAAEGRADRVFNALLEDIPDDLTTEQFSQVAKLLSTAASLVMRLFNDLDLVCAEVRRLRGDGDD